MIVVIVARILGLLLAVALVALFLAVPAFPLVIAPAERIVNGNFEKGFDANGVARDWQRFDNGGRASYVWQEEREEPLLWDGTHGQLIAIHTYDWPASDPDRFAGIYQTADVVPGEAYQLTLHGTLREGASDPDTNNMSYRVQWGVDYSGSADWRAVADWVEVPWHQLHSRLDPGPMNTYVTSIAAQSDRLTLFIRGWKKRDTPMREFVLNLDGISLKGSQSMPQAGVVGFRGPSVTLTAPTYPTVDHVTRIHMSASDNLGVTAIRLYDNGVEIGRVAHGVGMLTTEGDFAWTPTSSGVHTLRAEATGVAGTVGIATQTITVGETAEFVVNGGFEGGFGSGGTGLGWHSFDDGGQASYEWIDETWEPAVLEGDHAQMIGISTFGRPASDLERYAGVYQAISGLRAGATYQLRLHGLLRSLDEDPDSEEFGYRAQYGIDWSAGTDWHAVNQWHELPWDQADSRTVPGHYHTYTATLIAQSPHVTLYICGRQKWGPATREFVLNLDEISLVGYR